MARGSSGGGGGAATFTGTRIGMNREGGSISAQGGRTLNKRYFIQTDKEQDLLAIEQISGYRATSARHEKIANGLYEQEVEYKGEVNARQAPGLVETLQGISGTFEMFTSYESHPIELHPRIDKLSVDFGGYFTPDGFAKWPPFYTPGDAGGLGGSTQLRNPMFGVTRYKEVSMIFRHSYYVRGVARSIYDKAGKVVTTLPAGFPTPPGPKDKEGREIRRRWMMQMPAVSREGDSYRVVQEYVLLDTSGVADGLYETTSTPGNPG